MPTREGQLTVCVLVTADVCLRIALDHLPVSVADILNTPELFHKTVPLLLFYDGAEVYREQEYWWCLANSALAKGDVNM